MFKRKRTTKKNKKQMEFNFEKASKKEWTPIMVRQLLEKDEQWRIRAFFSLWNLTISGERDKKGFNRHDYNFAEPIWRSYKQFGEFTPRELGWIKREIPKYGKQLFEVKRGIR